MKALVKNIATIQTGYFAKPEAKGDIVYLQAKHFDEFGGLQKELHPDLSKESVSEKHLLKPGDVLFAAKGTKNFAAVYETHNPPAVASTSFFVLRISTNAILPNYLALYINHPSILGLLKAQATGTSLPSISKGVMDELEITIPDMATQQKIIKINQLRNKEKSLKQQIEKLRDEQIQQVIKKTIL